jgi:thioredoxin 1
MAKEITDSNFTETVLNSDQLTLIDFWAQWCGPCRAIAPIIEELAKEYEGKAVIGKVDVDQNQEIAMTYNIRSIPTLLFIKNGEVVDKHVGSTTKAALKIKLDKYLS